MVRGCCGAAHAHRGTTLSGTLNFCLGDPDESDRRASGCRTRDGPFGTTMSADGGRT